MSGDERRSTGGVGPTGDDLIPESVEDLVTSIDSAGAEVVVLWWTVDGHQRVTFAFDVAPVPASTALTAEATVDVRSVIDDPPVARPVPVASIEGVRPLTDTESATAALPEDPGQRAAVLCGFAAYDPALVDLGVVLCLLDASASRDESVATDALQCLSTLVADRPDECVAAIPRVTELVAESSETGVYASALTCLSALAAARPAEVAPHVRSVFSALDAADTVLVTAAATCVSHVASADPEAVVDAAEALVGLLDWSDAEVRMHAAYALGRIAVVAPETIRPEVTPLVGVVGDETARTATRLNATCAVGRVAAQWPGAVVEFLPTFVDALDDGDARIRANAAGVVGDIAATHAVAVHRHVTPLLGCLAAADSVTRANGSTALARIAREFPEALCDHVDRLVDTLDDEDPLVRENVCWTLGYLRDDAQTARPILERLRLDDGDERVRGRAAWALDEVGADGVGATD